MAKKTVKMTEEDLQDFVNKVHEGEVPLIWGHEEDASDIQNICYKLDVITGLLIMLLKGISTKETLISTHFEED